MRFLPFVVCVFILLLAVAGTSLAFECNGTNVLGTWHRHASGSFPDTATWTFLQDSTNSGSIQCEGDCIRKGGRPVEWHTPSDFFNEPGMIKIRFEKTELIMGCDLESNNSMIWTLNGQRAMVFTRY
ncbi:MAG: hypothetical protein GTO40_29135 [Deltaproteobacteria bacterium]|nr:hypothetical protein [Deltaproteobacteria bacterium]